MTKISIFDLVHPAQTPAENDLQAWLQESFPQTTDKSAFQLALQLEKLFEMSVFENKLDDVHRLLQQGVPPDLRWDWNLTPLMCANYLGYTKLAELLRSYGASSQARSFSGKKASDFANLDLSNSSEEARTILKRYSEIHNQVMAGLLKSSASSSETHKITKHPQGKAPQSSKKVRQIDNGKGVDELFKKISKPSN